MADMRKLIESVDSIDESISNTSFKTVANSDHFIRDVFSALAPINGAPGKTVNITVTAKGTNMLEYSINEVTPKVPPTEDEILAKAQNSRTY